MDDLRVNDNTISGIASQVRSAASAVSFPGAVMSTQDSTLGSNTVVGALRDATTHLRVDAQSVETSANSLGSSTQAVVTNIFATDAALALKVG